MLKIITQTPGCWDKKGPWVLRIKEGLQSLADMGLSPASATSLIVTLDAVCLSLSFPNYKMGEGAQHNLQLIFRMK